MHALSATVKRSFDLVAATFGVLVLGPAMAVIAVLVRNRLGPPVLFRQPRIGKEGSVFTITKFRTMTHAVDAEGALLPDNERLTPFGSKLRSLSLDELPELFDVLRGDMSLVGPRPLPVEYRDRYSAVQWRRHEVKPGITGWAQVNGRNALSWPEKFAHDVWYVDNRSLWVDLKILALTFREVVTRHGISAEDHVTMSEFLGIEEPEIGS